MSWQLSLKLLEFYKSFSALPATPGIHLVFIEEPEVHLHPQMQEVFIRKLGEIVESFAKNANNGIAWPVQFIVTTHSTHMANEASFETMRYFLSSPAKDARFLSTKIKDLRKGLGGESPEDKKFLHKYMTLTRCDLLFADKAILIEGTSERLLLPRMIEKVDEGQPDGRKLSSQYLSVVEIGGAYAHRFFKLLEFLELRTLIVTDIDAAKKNAANKLAACKVSESTHTSNGCIKDWFANADIKPADLIQKPGEEKVHGLRRLAHQVPESAGKPCGRSFEQAFMLANPDKFQLAVDAELEQKSWDMAAEIGSKSDFALEYAIEKTEWSVPLYIADGLKWLADGNQGVVTIPPAITPSATAPAPQAPKKKK